jgi:hypothetical protein
MGYGLIMPITTGYRLIPFTLITVAVPAQATTLHFRFGFDWQLGGPFGGGVRTGITPFPGSLGRRVNAYSSSSMLLDILRCCWAGVYRRSGDIVNHHFISRQFGIAILDLMVKISADICDEEYYFLQTTERIKPTYDVLI